VNRRGFTLVEVSVCLLVIAVIAGIVAVRGRGAHRQATMDQVVSDLVTLDSRLRQRARLLGEPQMVVFDETERTIQWHASGDASPATARNLPGVGHVEVLGLLGVPSVGEDLSGERPSLLTAVASAAEQRVGFTTEGTSPTYGWVLHEAASGRRSALLFAGLTGQWRLTSLRDGVAGSHFGAPLATSTLPEEAR